MCGTAACATDRPTDVTTAVVSFLYNPKNSPCFGNTRIPHPGHHILQFFLRSARCACTNTAYIGNCGPAMPVRGRNGEAASSDIPLTWFVFSTSRLSKHCRAKLNGNEIKTRWLNSTRKSVYVCIARLRCFAAAAAFECCGLWSNVPTPNDTRRCSISWNLSKILINKKIKRDPIGAIWCERKAEPCGGGSKTDDNGQVSELKSSQNLI